MIKNLEETNQNLSADVSFKLKLISDLRSRVEQESQSVKTRDESERLMVQETKLRQEKERILDETKNLLNKERQKFENYKRLHRNLFIALWPTICKH